MFTILGKLRMILPVLSRSFIITQNFPFTKFQPETIMQSTMISFSEKVRKLKEKKLKEKGKYKLKSHSGFKRRFRIVI